MLYECYERYRDASSLEILLKLEMCGVFSPINPAGLIEVARDIDRPDLVNMVKDFMKTQRKENEKKAKANKGSKVENAYQVSDEEMVRLRLSQDSELERQVNLERQTATEDSQRNRLVEDLEKVREAPEATHSLRMFLILSIVSHTVYSFRYCL